MVVVGESANRRHRSLYGYARLTTPHLQKISNELCVFTDVTHSTCVSTCSSIRGMLTTPGESVPVFHLRPKFVDKTHWISAQSGQGLFDPEMPALVDSCDALAISAESMMKTCFLS